MNPTSPALCRQTHLAPKEHGLGNDNNLGRRLLPARIAVVNVNEVAIASNSTATISCYKTIQPVTGCRRLIVLIPGHHVVAIASE